MNLFVSSLYGVILLQNIPMAFYSRYIDGTTNEGNAVVKLRSNASDITWQVKMDGRRLTQGWQKFATSHDLRVGDLIVFRHDGDLVFHVTCFGPSCCEIQYDDDDDVIQLSSGTTYELNPLFSTKPLCITSNLYWYFFEPCLIYNAILVFPRFCLNFKLKQIQIQRRIRTQQYQDVHQIITLVL